MIDQPNCPKRFPIRCEDREAMVITVDRSWFSPAGLHIVNPRIDGGLSDEAIVARLLAAFCPAVIVEAA